MRSDVAKLTWLAWFIVIVSRIRDTRMSCRAHNLCDANYMRIYTFTVFLVFLYDMYTFVNTMLFSFSSSFSVVCIKLTCILSLDVGRYIYFKRSKVTHTAKTMLLNIFHLVCTIYVCVVYLFALFLGNVCVLSACKYFLHIRFTGVNSIYCAS